jgi:hypothetical protein
LVWTGPTGQLPVLYVLSVPTSFGFSGEMKAQIKSSCNNLIHPMVKRILIIFFVVCLAGFSLIIYGLFLMDIEDRYGDLQDLYWQSQDGDLIVNNTDSRVGVVRFRNRRVFVDASDGFQDVESWLDPEHEQKFHATIYRPAPLKDITLNLSKKDITPDCEIITKVDIEY